MDKKKIKLIIFE